MDRRRCKKLSAVLWLIDNHKDALEYELIRHGLRLRQLGSPMLSWRDIWAIVANLQRGTPLARAIDPSMAWTQTDYWLQSIEYSLRWLVWAKTKDGSKNRKKPKPVEAPKPKKNRANGPRMTKRQLREYLARPRIGIPDMKPKEYKPERGVKTE